MSKQTVFPGDKFGRWTVVEFLGLTTKGNGRYSCCVARCDCGTVSTQHIGNLKIGKSKSCGCLNRELTSARKRTHGRSKDKERGVSTYNSWRAMKDRCSANAPARIRRYYFDMGVTICSRWTGSFESFVEDMGERPPGKTLDRIDPWGNYEPTNCRWATYREQQLNRRTSNPMHPSVPPLCAAPLEER